MGSGSSTAYSTEEKALIAQSLKEIYEANRAADDASLRQKMDAEYAKITTALRANSKENDPISVNTAAQSTDAHTAEAGGDKTEREHDVNKGASLEEGNKPLSKLKTSAPSKAAPTTKPASKERTTRRRSFDQVSLKKSSSPTTTLRTSASTAKLSSNSSGSALSQLKELVSTDTAVNSSPSPSGPSSHEERADCWDSVTEQPFCDLCKMAFKSTAFLARHIKFSELHSKNVKIKENGGDALQKEPSVSEKKELVVPMQEEGTHYRLLYSGSKFFWRLQLSLDIDIYHHFMAQCIEIVPFDGNSHRELPRLYLGFEDVVEAVQPSVQEAVQQRVKEILVDRFAEKPDEQKLWQEFSVQKMATFILQRLQYDHAGGQCSFVALFGDDEARFPLLEEAPTALVPISMTRRRRSSFEEFSSTVHSMRREYSEIDAKLREVAAYREQDRQLLAEAGIVTPVTPAKPKKNHGNEAFQSPTNGAHNEQHNYEYSARIAHFVFLAAKYISSKNLHRNPSLPYKGRNRLIAIIRKVIFRAAVARTRQMLLAKNAVPVFKSPFKKSKLNVKIADHA